MDRQLEQAIENLVAECLLALGAVQMDESERNQKIEQLRSYFLTVLFKTIVQEMSPEQIKELNTLETNREQFLEKLDEVMSEMPDLIFLVDENLQAEKEKIIKSKQIPLQ